MKKKTREWVRKAEADFVVAGQSSRSRTPLHDSVSFHSQQCAEKYLKALLEELGRTVPRTHNLDDLLHLLLADHPTLRMFQRSLIALTNYAVQVRYPGENTTKRQAASALRTADRVWTSARLLLGIRPLRRRKNAP
jgi:HEPN domain-containing protein